MAKRMEYDKETRGEPTCLGRAGKVMETPSITTNKVHDWVNDKNVSNIFGTD